MSAPFRCCLLSLALAAPAFAEEPLTFDRAIALALERNERVQTAQERLVAAEARLARARAFFFPQLAVGGNYTRRPQETTALNALSATATARVTVFDARGFPLHAQAAHDEKAAEYDALEERRLVAFQAAQAYLLVLSQEQLASAAVQRLEYAKSSLHDAQSRFEAQLVSVNDVTKARLEVATAERELASAKGDVESAYVTLGFVIAEDVKGPLEAPEPLVAAALQPRTRPPNEDQEALRRRLDVLARRERVEALNSFAEEPNARLLPSLGLSAQYRLTNEAGLAGRNGDGFAALDLGWTLFDGGVRYADRRERLANARAALLEAQAAERQLSADVRRADVTMTTAQAALKEAQVAADAAEQNAKEIATLYRTGLTSALEASSANVQRFDAQVALVRERLTLALAFLDLRSTLGLDPLGRDVRELAREAKR